MGIFEIIKQKVSNAIGTTEKAENNSNSVASRNSSRKQSIEDTSVFLNKNSFVADDTDIKGNDILSQLEDSLEDLTELLTSSTNEENKNKRTSISELTQENKVKQIISKAATGDVIEIPGVDNICIKTENGDYKELNISANTYNKLFKYVNNSDNDKINIGNNIEKFLSSQTAREHILSCFSEDEKGNITFTFPNSEYSFTLENGKSLSDYDESMQDYPSNIGIGMIELALGSMQTNKELDIINSKIQYHNEIIDKEKNNQSQAFINTINEALEYAQGDKNLQFQIADYYWLISENKSEEEIKNSINNDLFNILNKYPNNKLNQSNIDYARSKTISAKSQTEKKEFEENPYYSDNRNYVFNEEYILSTFGLNTNYEITSDEALSKAEEYMEKLNFPTTTMFDKNILATLLDDNIKGQEIIDYILKQGNTDIYYYDVQIYLKEATKENADIELLKKISKLKCDISNTYLIEENLITNENIDLIQNIQDKIGKVTKDNINGLNSILNCLPKETVEEYLESEDFSTILDITTHISSILPNGFKDNGTTRSELLKDEISQFINATLNGQNPEDVAVPTVDSISAGLNNCKIGDVFEVEDENKIYIKTNDNEYQQLDISKDAYNKLFPPIQKYMSSQGNIGDCYLVSSLNNMMTDPSMRSIVLNCFSEDENGNITVDLPNGDYTFTLENGKSILDYFPEEVTVMNSDTREEEIINAEQAISNSSLGMQMLEVCYGIYLQADESNKLIEELERININIQEDQEALNPEDKINADKVAQIINENINPELDFHNLLEILYDIDEECIEKITSNHLLPDCDKETLDNFVSLYKECINANISPGYIASLFYKNSLSEKINNIQNDLYGTKLRTGGGYIERVFDAFGLDCETARSIRTEEELIELLNTPNIKLIAGGTYGSSDDKMLNEDLYITENHAYTIRPNKLENGEYQFEVINPWNEARTSILTTKEMIEYFNHFDYIYT